MESTLIYWLGKGYLVEPGNTWYLVVAIWVLLSAILCQQMRPPEA